MVHGEQNKLKCISLVSGDIIFEVSAARGIFVLYHGQHLGDILRLVA